MKTETRYIASDNRPFNSVAECEAHEQELTRARKAEETMKSYVASDYAGIRLGFGSFYYGYEVEQNDEWCFRAQWISTNGVKRDVIIPFSELGARDSSECAECLMEGIAKLFERKLIAFTK